MDKLQYIPGDLVIYISLYKEPVAEICEVHKTSYIIKYMNGNFAEVTNEEIKAIPLTSEILEKNGWSKRTRVLYNGEHSKAFSNPSFPLKHFSIIFTKSVIKVTYDCLPVREIKYISDLQHLLFGLGIDNNMEV